MKVTRKILACALAALMVISSFAAMITVGAQTPEVSLEASSYNGTPDTDFETDGNVIYITSAEELMGFAQTSSSNTYSGKIIRLTTDVILNVGDATSWGTTAPDYAWSCYPTDGCKFAGSFDGQGHVISGIYSYHTSPKTSGVKAASGLFGVVAAGATVQNVKVINSFIGYNNNTNSSETSHNRFGGIVGLIDAYNLSNKTTTIANCYVEATLYTKTKLTGNVGNTGIGGILGYAGFGNHTNTINITNCSFKGSITGFRFVGGIAGRLDSDKITNIKNCYVDADIVCNNPNASTNPANGAAMLVGCIASHGLNVENYISKGTLKYSGNTTGMATLVGYIDCNADSKIFTLKNVLIASAPLANDDGAVYDTVLFNTFLRKSMTFTLENIVYDSTLYSRAATDDHIKVYAYNNTTISPGDAASFKATAKTTAELKGAEVFDGWTVVENDYPTPVTPMTTSGVDAYDGTPDTDFLTVGNVIYITSAEELMGFAQTSSSTTYSGKIIRLMTDVILNAGDATSWGTTAPEYAWSCYPTDGCKFAGSFDGQGHVISGIYSYHVSHESGKAASGLFGVVAAGATVQSIKVVNSFIGYNNNINGSYTSHNRFGGIVGFIDAYNQSDKTTTIANCYVEATLYTKTKLTGSVGNTGIGGIIGYAGFGNQTNTINITNCSFKGSITGFRFTGGIAGRLDSDKITNVKNCYVDADIVCNNPNVSSNPANGAAMLVGCIASYGLNVENCISKGTLKYSGNTTGMATLVGYIDCNADNRSFTLKNVLIASAPLANDNGAVYDTVLFNTFLRKSMTFTLENIVYDSTLYSRAATDDHIKVYAYNNTTISPGDAASFKATAKTTAELTGADGKALFSSWTEVKGDYPTPCAFKDVDDYGYVNYGTPVTMLGYQTRDNGNGTNDVRLLATLGIVEEKTYVAAGFKDVRITLTNGQTKEIPVYYCQYAYRSVIGAGETYTAEKYLSDSFICLTIGNAPANVLSIEATPFVMTGESAEPECGKPIAWSIGEVDATQLISVMSFNVYLHDDADPDGTDPATANDRINALQAQILAQDPDVICVQEDNWASRLDGLLTDYTAVRGKAISRSGWTGFTYESYEYQTIYYKTGKFTLESNGVKALSNTPDTQFSEFEGDNGAFKDVSPRGFNYAELKLKDGGETFFVFNVHLENYSPTKRMMEAEKLVELVGTIAGDTPSIMCGDFNLKPDSTEEKDKTARGYLDTNHENSCEVADITETHITHLKSDEYFGVAGATATSTSGSILDYCFTSKGDFYVHSYDVISGKQISGGNSFYTSDHYPIVTKLLIRSK